MYEKTTGKVLQLMLLVPEVTEEGPRGKTLERSKAKQLLH